jgi:outer membrane murein-binding lipoprotein Lpp/ribosomal protein L40E
MAGQIKKLPKWLDRAGFEADKLMRANRVRNEAGRLRDRIDAKTQSLGTKVLELAAAGNKLDPDLSAIVDEILAFQTEVARKEEEIKTISAEQWVEPAPPPQPAPPPDPIAERLQAYIESKVVSFACPKCGSTIRANATFCPKCGRKVLR